MVGNDPFKASSHLYLFSRFSRNYLTILLKNRNHHTHHHALLCTPHSKPPSHFAYTIKWQLANNQSTFRPRFPTVCSTIFNKPYSKKHSINLPFLPTPPKPAMIIVTDQLFKVPSPSSSISGLVWHTEINNHID